MTGTLAGFQLASYIPGMLGVNSRVATVPFRVLMLGVIIYALYQLLASHYLRMGMSVTTILVLFFWTAYCLRFIADAAVLQVPLGQSPSDMALYLFAMCLPTFMVFYLIADISLYRKALTWSMLALGLCCAPSILLKMPSRDASPSQQNAGNTILNHISFGHMGLTAIFLGLFVCLQIGRVSRPKYLRVLAVGVVVLGAYVLLVATSRGAIVTAILLIPVVVYLGFRHGSKVLTVAMCVLVVFVSFAFLGYLSRQGMNLERLVSYAGYTSADDSVFARENMYRDAWGEYLDNPLLGSSIVERNALFYPHNSVIEAFMATGTFGGAAFCLLLLIASYRGIKMINRDCEMAWVPICFFQQLIASMFSGGIYANSMLWGMMAIMLGADLPRARLGASRG